MIDPRVKMKGYKNLKKVFRYYRRHPFLFFSYIAITMVYGILSFVSPILIGQIVDNITKSMFEPAIGFAALLFGISTFGNSLALVNVRVFKNLENKVKLEIKLDIVKSALEIKMSNYDELGNGLFITRLTEDLMTTSMSFISLTERFVSFVSKLGFIIYVYFVNLYIALFLTAFILIKFVIYKFRVYYLSVLKPIYYKKVEDINSIVGEGVRGIRDIKVLNGEQQLINRVEQKQLDVTKADNKEWYIGVFWLSLGDFANTLWDFLFIVLSVYLIGVGNLPLAVFYTIFIYKNNIMNFAVTMSEMQIYLKQVELSASRVFALQDSKLFPTDNYGTNTIDKFKGGVTFSHVTFGYKPNEPILKDISFELKPKKITAFVGESGCGKSTIISLIAKLYEVTEGEILFDDVNMNTLSKEFLKNNVTVITQMPYIFNMTIRENFQLVKEGVTDEEIYAVCEQVGFADYLKNAPQGLDTIVGEGGAKISGGQRQKLSIARALLKNSKILVFDESTSSLDNKSQSTIIDTVNKQKSARTVVIIAHRLNTILNADNIVFIKDGKVNGSGTHKELLVSNANYKALYDKENSVME